MSLRDLARTTLTVKAVLVLIAAVLARVAVRILRRWIGDDFLDAGTASMIVTALDGLIVVAFGVVGAGLRRAIEGRISQSRTEHTLSIHADTAEAEEKLERLAAKAHKVADEVRAVPQKRNRKTVSVTRPPPKRGKGVKL